MPEIPANQERLVLIQRVVEARPNWPPNIRDILNNKEIMLKVKSLLAKICLENSGLT